MVSMKGAVLFSQMRTGIKRIAPEVEDGLMLELQAPFHTEMANRRAKWIGPVELAVLGYPAYYELHVPLGENLVVLTIEKSIPFAEIHEIGRKIRDLSQ
jgi:hypothetical protein